MPTSTEPVPAAGPVPAAAGGPVRVAVCDDHRVFAEALAAVLRVHGYAVTGVLQDPRHAVKQLADDPVDLCVMDLGFPDADGIDTPASSGRRRPAYGCSC